MIERIATKRDVNGNRYYLIIDHEKKIFSRNQHGWFNKEDYIEVTKKARRLYISELETNNYKEVDAAL